MARAAAHKLLALGTGSIAAIKLPDLLTRLNQGGVTTELWLTEAARHWADLPGPILSEESEEEFVGALTQTDAVLIVPASASAIARLAHGIGASAVAVRKSGKPVMVVPAMNIKMWQHAATQRNAAMLRRAGVHFLGPVEGDLACGDVGHGRMMEPYAIAPDIIAALQGDFTSSGFGLIDAAVAPVTLSSFDATRMPSRVLLLCGGAEAEKLPAFISALRAQGTQVTLALSEAAFAEDAQEKLAQLSGQPVYVRHWQHDPQGFEHIRLGESVDAILVALLDARMANRMRTGLADDFLMATYLASKAPVFAVAAHDAPEENDLELLRADGVKILPRGDGLMPFAWSSA